MLSGFKNVKANYLYIKLKRNTIIYQMIKFMLISIIVLNQKDLIIMNQPLHSQDSSSFKNIIKLLMFTLKYISNSNTI